MKTIPSRFALATKALFTGAFAMCLAAASADTFKLASTGTSASPVPWADPSSWTDSSGAAVSVYPGASDTITWSGTSAYISLDGNYSVGTLTDNYKQPHFYRASGVSDPVSLTFTGTLGLWGYWYHHVYDGVSIVVTNTAEMGCSRGDHGDSRFNIYSGGTVEIRAQKIRSRVMRYNVSDGGTLVFAPVSYEANSQDSADHDEFKVDNGGAALFPSGIIMTGTSPNAQLFNHNGGTVTFGGNFTSGPDWTYTWKGGTLAVTGAVSFGDNIAVVVPDSSSVTLDIASGATLAIPTLSWGSGVTVTKTGVGDFAFLPGNMPDTLAVSTGAVALNTANTSYDLSTVNFSAGTKVKIGATGVTLSNWNASLANATFAVADGYIPANGATVLTIADARLLAQARTGLNASLAGTGVSVETSGNSLVAQSHYTFNSSSVSDMNDTTGWVSGFAAPAGQPATISGSSTEAVMDGSVPAYSEISVEDGASLTISATRNLPATTLASGTALAVVSSAGTVVMENRSYSGYIMDTATLVGTMSPSRSLSEITDIVGIRGGGWFGERSNPYTYVNTKIADGGATLHTQFIYNDSDWTKCAFVDFTKDAQGNIYAQGVGAGYISPTSEPVDFDEIAYTAAAYGTSNTSGAYGVKNLTFQAPVVYGGPSTVTAVGDFETTGSGSVTVDVAADCVLDLSGVDVTTAATLVKTGAGAIVFGDELPTALNVAEGILVLQPYVEYDMAAITVANGVDIQVAVGGEYVDCISTSGQNGTTIYMTGFTYVGVGGWNTLANWAGHTLPDASSAVHIYGVGTVLTLDAEPATMPASIVVEGGATLRVATDVTPPMLTLDKEATLEIASGTTTLANGLTSIALVDGGVVTLPTLAVQSGATLNVPANTKFKNVDMRLFGTISETGKGSLYLGHAESGETTYFAMNATNATISTIGSSDSYAQGQLWIACSEVGGTVSVTRRIELNGVTLDVPKYDGMYIGSNNPTNIPFDVLLENITKEYRGYWAFCGAATVTCRNCAFRRPAWQAWSAQGKWNVLDAAKLIYEGTTHYYEYPDGNSVNWSPVTAGAECFVLRDSTVMWTRPTGNYNGTMTVYDSFYDCAYDAYAPSQGQTLPDLLKGLGTLNIPAGAFCAIRAKDHVTWDINDDATERICKIDARTKFAGAGDLVISNSVAGRYFEVTMQSGDNTCTGTLTTYSPGNFNAKSLFANGANWAGTVVANGAVALTNLTDAASPVAVSFGGVDLQDDLTIRVWPNSDNCDKVNVGATGWLNNGGQLVLAPQGGDPVGNETWTIGTVPADYSGALPVIRRKSFQPSLEAIPGDADHKAIVVHVNAGTVILLR